MTEWSMCFHQNSKPRSAFNYPGAWRRCWERRSARRQMPHRDDSDPALVREEREPDMRRHLPGFPSRLLRAGTVGKASRATDQRSLGVVSRTARQARSQTRSASAESRLPSRSSKARECDVALCVFRRDRYCCAAAVWQHYSPSVPWRAARISSGTCLFRVVRTHHRES